MFIWIGVGFRHCFPSRCICGAIEKEETSANRKTRSEHPAERSGSCVQPYRHHQVSSKDFAVYHMGMDDIDGGIAVARFWQPMGRFLCFSLISLPQIILCKGVLARCPKVSQLLINAPASYGILTVCYQFRNIRPLHNDMNGHLFVWNGVTFWTRQYMVKWARFLHERLPSSILSLGQCF